MDTQKSVFSLLGEVQNEYADGGIVKSMKPEHVASVCVSDEKIVERIRSQIPDKKKRSLLEKTANAEIRRLLETDGEIKEDVDNILTIFDKYYPASLFKSIAPDLDKVIAHYSEVVCSPPPIENKLAYTSLPTRVSQIHSFL